MIIKIDYLKGGQVWSFRRTLERNSGVRLKSENKRVRI